MGPTEHEAISAPLPSPHRLQPLLHPPLPLPPARTPSAAWTRRTGPAGQPLPSSGGPRPAVSARRWAGDGHRRLGTPSGRSETPGTATAPTSAGTGRDVARYAVVRCASLFEEGLQVLRLAYACCRGAVVPQRYTPVSPLARPGRAPSVADCPHETAHSACPVPGRACLSRTAYSPTINAIRDVAALSEDTGVRPTQQRIRPSIGGNTRSNGPALCALLGGASTGC